jgi:glyoxylase-like metal-dependent hydrolase (beta-lactamase superfamily II)
MKPIFAIFLLAFSGYISAMEVEKNADERMVSLSNHKWNHGSFNCEKNDDPAIEVYQYSDTTFLLRQNKCIHYEAPFIYVLFGAKTIFVQDTGATSDPKLFPLYHTIKNLVQQKAKSEDRNYEDFKWLVTHSHSHSDHIAADDQFRNKPNVTLIEPNLEAVQKAFNLDNERWPYEHAHLDLGDRRLTIIPLPGHKSDAVAVYDSETQWLLTGDSLYPGRLYVKEWKTFRASIKRLRQFAQSNPILALMGTHIEMSNTPKQDYKMGSTYQPAEAELPMSPRDLSLLNDIMQGRMEPSRVVTERFIVYPLD